MLKFEQSLEFPLLGFAGFLGSNVSQQGIRSARTGCSRGIASEHRRMFVRETLKAPLNVPKAPRHQRQKGLVDRGWIGEGGDDLFLRAPKFTDLAGQFADPGSLGGLEITKDFDEPTDFFR
ncbi:hypothetical protein [Hyphomicrobium facile]|uniref:hypothetical protein n=1 Tax=Hyphomicrobium facile TaxID=51670 RepID=UPI0015A6EFB2|nr:hypothetical protein [Hyphomicrobium facile]